MLSEPALRSATFDPNSHPVRCGDGQDWYFPRPAIDLQPAMSRRGSVPVSRTTLGHEFDRALDHAMGEVGGPPPLEAMFHLGRVMLSRNYQIPDAAWWRILRYDPWSEDDREMWQTIMDIAAGHGPKTVDSYRLAALAAIGGYGGRFLYLDEANAVVEMGIIARRVPSADRWIPELVAEREANQFAAMAGSL